MREIYTLLELRVGATIASLMTENQLKGFETIIAKNDDEAALRWLEGNFRSYKIIVKEQVEVIRDMLKRGCQLLEDPEAKIQVATQKPAGSLENEGEHYA